MNKNNTGSVWKNTRREKETHPHWTGTAVIEGVEYWVSAWKKDDDAPEKAPSIKFSFKAKDEAPKKRAPQQDDFVDSDIPF